MKIQVRVKPGAKKAGIERHSDGSLVIQVKEPAREGKANKAVTSALAEYFEVPKGAVTIVGGHTGRKKWIEITKGD